MTTQFTATLAVACSPYTGLSPESMARCTDPKYFYFCDPANLPSLSGYTLAGTAVIDVTLYSLEEITVSRLDTLQSELAKDREESQLRQNRLRDEISKLQSLTLEVPA